MIGYDLSKYQGNIDFTQFKADFAIIKVGYGVSYTTSQIDPKFSTYFRALDGKMPLGVYYYSYGKKAGDGKKEAQNCIAYMKMYGVTPDKLQLPVFYDIEDKTNDNVNTLAKEWVETIEAAGYRAGLYSYTSYIKSTGLNMNLAKYRWIANYGSNNGTQQEKYKPSNCDIWQYSSKANTAGISGNVDVNVMLNNIIEDEDDDMLTQKQFDEYMDNWLERKNKKEPAADSWIATNKTMELGKDKYKICDGTRAYGLLTRAEGVQMIIKAIEYIINKIGGDDLK